MHARDAAQSCADIFKFREIMHAEAQADDGGAAADGAGAHFACAQTQRRENCCNIQHQSVAVVGLDLQRRGEHHVRGLRPGDLDPAALLRGVERGPGIRAILPVNGHTVALGDKADDLVAGNRRAAAAEFDHARADVLDNDAGGIDGGRILPRKRLGGKRPGCLGQIIADAAHSLRSGQTAVADGGIHIVKAVERQLFQKARQQLGILQDGGIDVCAAVKTNYELSIVMLDCGRKYFSVDSIKQIIDNAAAAGFNNVMLAVGNDGMRFLLDDMSLTVNGTTYSSEEVAAALHTGNEAYYNFTTDELVESEMDEIIAYAKTKGLGIIPVINTPGHMDAILDAAEALTGKTCSYNGSGRTIDVTNSTAVAFTQALLQKYVDYFAGKGCKYFNMGADEYANDMFTGGSMGFGNLQSEGKYSYYVTYVNDVAAMIKNADMTPMAFNDGIYFNNNTSSGTFDTDIVICYWSNGWSSYTPMPAETLASMGFKMVNTHGDYYWVLGKSDWQCDAKKASGFNYKTFQGGTIDNPSGAMFCIWCDYPGAGTEAKVISNSGVSAI